VIVTLNDVSDIEDSPLQRVAVVGLGHVGAPLAVAMSASPALRVEGIDRDRSRLNDLGAARGVEPALAPHLLTSLERGVLCLKAQLQGHYAALVVAIEPAGVEPLISLTLTCLDHLTLGGILIIASTCQPQWFEPLIEACKAQGHDPGVGFHLAHAPERMMPGRAFDEVVELPRVVGGYTPECVARATRYYARFVHGEVRGVRLEAAALIKIAENAYRAVNVVLANEIADVAARHELSATEIIAAANTHPRVNVHTPGAGAWGRCLPLAMELLGAEGSELARVASALNRGRPRELVRALCEALDGVVEPVVVVCGVAYKRNLSDGRNSAGVHVIEALRERGCEVRVVDPHVPGLAYWGFDDALSGAHGVIYTVAHAAFEAHVFEDVRSRLDEPALIVDATGQLGR
jgi:UDP-N-acetyl-D-mannosaminuronic acid dehydrogenase